MQQRLSVAMQSGTAVMIDARQQERPEELLGSCGDEGCGRHVRVTSAEEETAVQCRDTCEAGMGGRRARPHCEGLWDQAPSRRREVAQEAISQQIPLARQPIHRAPSQQ